MFKNIRNSETTLGQAFDEQLKHAYAANDRGHQRDHFIDVESLALEMNQRMKLGCDPTHITTVAWTHDLFAWSRKNHHVLSAEWIRTTDHPLIQQFDHGDRQAISAANACHRASFRGIFPTVLSELMSSADRGSPGNLRDEILRSVEYSETYLGMNIHDALLRAVVHQQEKYGRNGYAKIPDIYYTYFESQMEERFREIDELQNLTFDELTRHLNITIRIEVD